MEEKSLDEDLERSSGGGDDGGGSGGGGDDDAESSSLADLARVVEASESEQSLVIAFFFRPWLPSSLATKAIVERVEASGKLSGFAKFFLINADKDRSGCTKLGVSSCPTLMLFWDGKPVTLRRPGWDDSLQLVGPFTEETLVSLGRFAREMSGEVLPCDF